MSLCLVVTEKSIPDVHSIVDCYAGMADLFEIRADYLEESALEELETIKTRHPSKKLIFTVRKQVDGGMWAGPEALRESLYERALDAGFDYIDLELGFLPRVKRRGKTSIIRSHHDFAGVPSDIEALFEKAGADGEELPKLSVMLKDIDDALRFMGWLEALKRKEPRGKIITAMGRRGLFSRILGGRIGTTHTYFSAPGKSIVPGMIDLRQALEVYKIRSIDEHTRIFGLIEGSAAADRGRFPALAAGAHLPGNGIGVPFVVESETELAVYRNFFKIEKFFSFGNDEPAAADGFSLRRSAGKDASYPRPRLGSPALPAGR